MRRLCIAAMLTLFLVGNAWAEDGEGDDVMTGKAVVKMNSDYAKAYVDGEAYEMTEFEDDGKTILIFELTREKNHVIRLVPMYPELGPEEFTITAKDWKLQRIDRGVKEWQFRKQVVFKAPKKSAPAPAAPALQAPKAAPAAPPIDKKKAGADFLKGTPAKKPAVKTPAAKNPAVETPAAKTPAKP